jgi:RNA polymerase sigma-70 factor (ECF subfamily)
MSAFAHLKCFEGRSTFSCWLTSIAINSALMILKKRRGVVEVSLEQVRDDSESLSFWEPRDQGETPEACCMRREREQILSNVIGRLPSTFREPVELRYVRGYSVAQVAEELGISHSAAKTKLMRARKRTRQRLPKAWLRTATKPTSSEGHRRAVLSGRIGNTYL